MNSEITSESKTWLYEQNFRRAALVAILVSAGYYLTSRIGFRFALQPGSVSLLWMPNSLLFAGLLLVPSRWWWLIILAAFPTHVASQWQSGVPMPMVLSWFLSNSIQALLGAVCLTRFAKDGLRFDRTKDLTVFLICGVFLAPFVASFIDGALVKLNGWGQGEFWDIWRVRFLSNVLATLTLVPSVLIWVTDGIAALRKARLIRYVEAIVLTASLFAVGFFLFDAEPNFGQHTPLLWIFPFILWATVRFGPIGVTNALLIVMFLAISGVTRGAGPFVTSSAEDSALSIQLFLIAASIPLMVLAAVMAERGRAESAARDNEERLTFALSAAGMDTWEWHATDSRWTWSEAGKAAFEVKAGSHSTGESLQNVVHPEDQEALESAIARSIAEGVPCDVEFRIIRNGRTRWFLSKGKVICDDAGNPTRVLGIGTDVTERKHAEQALIESTSRNQAILRAIPDMMFLMRKDGVYLDYYTRDPGQLLVPPESFLGKNVRDVLPQELAERVMNCFARLDHDAPPQVLDYDLHIDGETRHYEARMVTAHKNDVLSIVRDVTKERRAVEQARQSQEKLLQSNKQIRDLAARLIAAQESERRRISLLLHDDVNQNIAVMGLGISRLKSKVQPSDKEIIAGLQELAQQTRDLTAQIRDLSHHLHPGVLEHLGLVAALKSHVAEYKQQESIEATFIADVGTEPISADVAACLYRVALEALHNASRHSGAASAKIELKEEDGYLTLEVSDSGRGFDVEKARRGTGIGLASSEERIRLLQGNFEVRSSFQNGTVLIARVPRLA